MAVTATFAVAACSHSDEDISSENGKKIEFEASASAFGNETRSAEITTTENIPEFKIWAYDYGLYSYIMDGVTVTRTGLNSWSYSPSVDWTGNMICFTAISPVSIDINTNPWWLDQIVYENEGSEDLVVCRKTNVEQTSGRLKLHFYHALSLVNVCVRTSLPANRVRVKSVTIVNVSDNGNFQYPAAGFNSNTTLEDVSECWQIYWESNRIPVFLSDEGTLLTGEILETNNQGYDFFIPSRLGEFNFDTYFNSSYLEVDYRIENADGTTSWPDASTDYRLLSRNNPGYGQLRIGLGDQLPSSRWIAGKEYRYTVNISGPAEVPPGAASESTRGSTNDDMTVDVTIL